MHWYEDDKILTTPLKFFFLELPFSAFLKPSSGIYFKSELSHDHVLVIRYSDEKIYDLKKAKGSKYLWYLYN